MRINTLLIGSAALLIGSAVVLSTALVTSTPAAAEAIIVTENPEPRAAVSVADLNLGSPAGIATLQRRIEGAAADLCLTTAVEPIDIRMARAECYRTAISSGQRQIDRIMTAPGDQSATVVAAGISVTGR